MAASGPGPQDGSILLSGQNAARPGETGPDCGSIARSAASVTGMAAAVAGRAENAATAPLNVVAPRPGIEFST